jgi:hypothetical protein
MPWSDEQLGELYRCAHRRDRAGQECPGTDELTRGACGGLDEEGRGRLAEHLARCTDCAEEYRLARALHPAVAAAASRRPLAPQRQAWLRIAAALLLTVGAVAGLWQLRQGGAGPGEVRGGALAAVAVVPAPGAVLSEPPGSLRWAELLPGASHRVVLLDVEGTALWRAEGVTGLAVEIPAEVAAALAPGRYYWRVEALRGVERQHSPLHGFRIAVEP